MVPGRVAVCGFSVVVSAVGGLSACSERESLSWLVVVGALVGGVRSRVAVARVGRQRVLAVQWGCFWRSG